MISKKIAASIVVGSAAGGIAFLTESALVGILPPLGGVTPWLPNAVLLLIALGIGIACGLLVCVFTRIPKQFVLLSSITTVRL